MSELGDLLELLTGCSPCARFRAGTLSIAPALTLVPGPSEPPPAVER
jgi:hypothetical protein